MHVTTGLPTIARDVIALIARVGLGVILIADGWQKLNDWTIAGATDSFS